MCVCCSTVLLFWLDGCRAFFTQRFGCAKTHTHLSVFGVPKSCSRRVQCAPVGSGVWLVRRDTIHQDQRKNVPVRRLYNSMKSNCTPPRPNLWEEHHGPNGPSMFFRPLDTCALSVLPKLPLWSAYPGGSRQNKLRHMQQEVPTNTSTIGIQPRCPPAIPLSLWLTIIRFESVL